MIGHRFAIILSGLIWMIVGIFLLHKGLNYLVAAGQDIFNGSHKGFSLILLLTPLVGNLEKGAITLLCIGLILGFLKGRIILKKSVNRIVHRICTLPSPLPITKLYPKGYYFLLLSMMLLGIAFKYLPLPLDVKGLIDFAVGVALINGTILYLQAAFTLKKVS